MNKNMIGALLVSMAAGYAVAADTVPAPADAKAKTEYVCQNNSCKGKADCMGFGNDSCKGNNACKGHGTLKATSKKECEKNKTGLWVVKK